MDIDHGHSTPAEEAMEYDQEVEMGSAGGAENPEGDDLMMDDDDDHAGDAGGEEEYIEADEEEIVEEGNEAVVEEAAEREEEEEEEMEAEELGRPVEAQFQGRDPAQPEAGVTGSDTPGAAPIVASSGLSVVRDTGNDQPVAGPSSPRPDVAGPTRLEGEGYGEHGADGGFHGDGGHAEENEETGEQDDGGDHPDTTDYPYPADSETLPPIVVHLPAGGTRSLFSPLPEVSEEAPNGSAGKNAPAVWLEGRQAELAEASLADVWAAVRAAYVKEAKAQLGGGANAEVGDLGEMVLDEKLMALKMGEDDVNLQSITLLELVQLYYSCDLPFPLNLELSFQPNRFIARYNAIKSEIDAQADAEADEGYSDVDEEDEGEECEHDVKEDKVHEDAQRTTEDEAAAGRSGDEDAYLPSQSINMNESPVVSCTAAEPKGKASGVELSTDDGAAEGYEQNEEYDEEEGVGYEDEQTSELPATISTTVSQGDDSLRTLSSDNRVSAALGGTPAAPPPAQLDLLGEPPLDEKALRDNRNAIQAASHSQDDGDVDGVVGPLDSSEGICSQAEAEAEDVVGDKEDVGEENVEEEADLAEDPPTAGDADEDNEAAYEEEEGEDGDEQITQEQHEDEEQYELESDEDQDAGNGNFLKNIADAAVASAEDDEGQDAQYNDVAEDAQDEAEPQEAAAAAAAEDVVQRAEEVNADADALEAKVADVTDQTSISAGTAASVNAEADELTANAKRIEREAAKLPDKDELGDEDAGERDDIDVEHDADDAGDDSEDELEDEDEDYGTGQDPEENGTDPDGAEGDAADDDDRPPVSSASKRTFLENPVEEGDDVPDAKRQKA